MRTGAALFVGIFLLGAASTAFAGHRKPKAPADPFGELFGAGERASKPKKPARSARRSSKARAQARKAPAVAKPVAAQVAKAAPAPSADENALVLSDFASGRHAWVGP